MTRPRPTRRSTLSFVVPLPRLQRVVPLLLIAAGLLAAGCQRTPERPRNVLVLSLDTVRADRLGFMGREQAGTTHFDGLARRGVVLSDALAPSPITLPSHCTLLTGQDTWRHRVRHNSLFALPEETTTLAERLAAEGLATGAFVGSAVLAARHGLDQGFERYASPEVGNESALFFISDRSAFEVNRDFFAWIESESASDRPFFAWLHYMEAHAPYAPPEPERSRFRGDPYQGEIATADRAFGEVLAALERLGRLDDTLILVVSDHGEDLGDHGEFTHGIFVYQSTLHVPFVVAGPGVEAGGVLEQPVGLVDVAPTVLEALGFDGIEPYDGRSLWPALTGKGDLDPERSLYAETFVPRYDYGWSELRALKSGRDKYIQAPRPELYDLASDPGETADLARRKAPLARELEAELSALEARAVAAGEGAPRIQLSAAELEALASLGYLSGSHAGGAGGQLADPKDKVQFAVELDRAGELLRRGDFPGAERRLREILAYNPEMLEARLSLLISLLLQLKLDEAQVVGEDLIERGRALPNGERIVAKAHVFLGKLHLDAGRLEEAAAHWEQALLVPQPAMLYELLAETYRSLDRPEEVRRVLDEAEARGESSPALTSLRAASP